MSWSISALEAVGLSSLKYSI